eukprot:Tamp_14834.p2 GENE.Tamp_14834~~Tamp_14834.p2  ORF type:complete len:192 (-),score=13.78 Tamp_14834:460-1035(-)
MGAVFWAGDVFCLPAVANQDGLRCQKETHVGSSADHGTMAVSSRPVGRTLVSNMAAEGRPLLSIGTLLGLSAAASRQPTPLQPRPVSVLSLPCRLRRQSHRRWRRRHVLHTPCLVLLCLFRHVLLLLLLPIHLCTLALVGRAPHRRDRARRRCCCLGGGIGGSTRAHKLVCMRRGSGKRPKDLEPTLHVCC